MMGWLRASLQPLIGPLPQWSPIALAQPQEAVQVLMSGPRGDIDVTRNAVVAALDPLTLGLGLHEQPGEAIDPGSEIQLRLIDLVFRRTLGTLQLQHVRTWDSAGGRIGLFEVRRGMQRCLPWPHRSWNRWLQNRAMRRNADPNNFRMPPEAVQQQMIFYICPRPVVLVSVDDGQHSNLFPMDLIGAIAPNSFTLALRNTSQSVPTMKSARRVALSDIPARERASAYKLGVHHRNVQVDWGRLPFEIVRSARFGLRCPASALRIRELEILDFDTIGSHTLFVSRVVAEQPLADGEQLFHTSAIYEHFRRRRGQPFAAAG
jgi:flavin reductase (DIM6/NTAB) family NADH-FMN oxidoreductase RutF